MQKTKVNLGSSLLTKEKEIQALTGEVNWLETENTRLSEENSQMKKEAKIYQVEAREKDGQVKMLELELAQLQMKLTSWETAGQRQTEQSMLMREAQEGSVARIEALSRENAFLKDKQIELENSNGRLAADLKVCTGRLDKFQALAVELQQTINKKQGDIGTLEKALARKNDHLALVLKKGKAETEEEKSILDKTRKEKLLDRISGESELDTTDGKESKGWKQAMEAVQTQLEASKKKIRRLETDIESLEKENKKIKDDNFYLTNRLKSLRK